MLKTANRHDELKATLERLKLPTMAKQFPELALHAAKEGLSHEAYLQELARLEEECRQARRTERLLRQSGLPLEKTFRTFDWHRASRLLFSCRSNGSKRAVFSTRRSTSSPWANQESGKAMRFSALGQELILKGYPVLWTPTSALVQRLLAAKRDLRLPQELAKLDKYSCVILDDIGYVQHDRDEMEVLFTFLSERYERKSVLITTNLVFSEWNRIFKDPMTTIDVS